MCSFLEKKGLGVVGYSRGTGQDLFNLGQLKSAVKRSDIVIHCAAEAKPGESVLHPVDTIDINIKGSLNVLEACREYNVPLIYPSSCEVYGDSDIPITEEHPLNPTNPYAASKTAIDRFCYMYARCYKLDVKIVRFFNPYGPYQQLNKIIPTFYFNAVKNKPIPVFGEGKDIRDYVYVSDIVRGLWMSKKLPLGEHVNLATGIATTNLQVAEMVTKAVGSNSDIEFREYPKTFGGILRQVGDNKKAKEKMGWQPKVSFEEGLLKTIKWLETVKDHE
jgi:nucleoside-diphosphate-sugar epimerase